MTKRTDKEQDSILDSDMLGSLTMTYVIKRWNEKSWQYDEWLGTLPILSSEDNMRMFLMKDYHKPPMSYVTRMSVR